MSQPLFTNGNFEDGTLNGWAVYTHLNKQGILFPPTQIEHLRLEPGGLPRTFAQSTPQGPESQIPAGLSAADSLRWPRYGRGSAVVNEEGTNHNVNRMVQSAKVTAADVDPADGRVHIRFTFAPVLQNPDHTAMEQPYFFVNLRNVTRGIVLWSKFNYANQPGVPWKTSSNGTTLTLYTNWQSIDVAPGDAQLTIGDTVELEVIAAGCSQGGHSGHVYVDAFGAFLPGLSIAATAPQFANANTDLTYSYLVKNSGEATATNVTTHIVLPANTTFVSYNAPSATCVRSSPGGFATVSCNLGTLTPTASTSFQITVHIAPSATGTISHGNYTIQADSISPLIGPLVETTLTTNALYADLSATVTDGVAAVSWGQPVQYTLTISNNGPQNVTGATITDSFPAELTAISWSCAGTGGATCGADSGTGAIHTTADLPAGSQATFTVNANVVAGSGSGILRNTVTVAPPAGIQDSDNTNNTAADVDDIGTLRTLKVDKSPAPWGGTVVISPGSISCGTECRSASASFLDGSQVSLTATAVPGSTFTRWSGACEGITNSCTLALTAEATVTAIFTLQTYAIHASTLGAGGGLHCPSPVQHGFPVTCTATPAAGSVLVALTDNGADAMGAVTGSTSYTIASVTQEHTLVATFKKNLGAVCVNAGECASNVCADGVCCTSTCDGQCEACDVSGLAGTCIPVEGAPHGERPDCASDGTVCGGFCDGTNRTACTYPGATVQCRTASCAQGVATLAAACDGAGACPSSETQLCAPYVCGATACLGNCTTDSDCGENLWCSAGVCVEKKTNGDTCGGNGQCLSGYCTDGVCCNSACDGQCEACNETGSAGMCSPVTGSPRGGRPICASDGTACGGFCDGTQRTACSYPDAAVHCGTPSCVSGVATLLSSCNGEGACSLRTKSCDAYTCGEETCLDTCSFDTDCVASSFCLAGQCLPRGEHSRWKVEGSGCSSTGSLGAGWLLGLVLLTFLPRRRQVATVFFGAAVLTVPVAARAEPAPLSRSFPLDRFQPQPGGSDILGVQSARVGAHLSFSARLFASYAHEPLRIVSLEDAGFQRALVANQSYLTLVGSLALHDRFELGASLPVMLSQRLGAAEMVDLRLQGSTASAGLSELRLSVKAALVKSEGHALSLALPFTLPTARRDAYLGRPGLTASPRLIGELQGPRGLSVMANAGLLLGGRQRFLNLDMGTALTYGLGGKIDLVPHRRLSLVTTLTGEVGLARSSPETSPLELLIALRWGVLENLEATLGGGPGLSHGYGTPRYRIVVGLGFAPGSAAPKPFPAPAPVQSSALAPMPPLPPPPTVSDVHAQLAAALAATTPLPEPELAPQPEAVSLQSGKIQTLDKVYFGADKAELLPVSLPVLDRIAELMASHGHLKVRIEAHTDNTAQARYNQQLSERRAESVRQYLIQKGTAPDRLEAVGCGMARPVDTNDTPEGRANNRRVEFVIQ